MDKTQAQSNNQIRTPKSTDNKTTSLNNEANEEHTWLPPGKPITEIIATVHATTTAEEPADRVGEKEEE